MIDIGEIEKITNEAIHRHCWGSLQAEVRHLHLIKQVFELVALVPKLGRGDATLFGVASDGEIKFTNAPAEQLHKLLAANVFEFMQGNRGERFHPIIELMHEVHQQRPLAMNIFHELDVNENRAARLYTSFDLVQALNEFVKLLRLGLKSYVFKEKLNKWNARLRNQGKRVEMHLDKLAGHDPELRMFSFSLVEPGNGPLDARHVKQTLRDKDALISKLKEQPTDEVRGFVVRIVCSPEGVRYDVLAVVARDAVLRGVDLEMQRAWSEVTQCRGAAYCVDAMPSNFSYRSTSRTLDLPISEHRRRLAVYFGQLDWLVRWEALGTDSLTMVECTAPRAGWPFPPPYGVGYSTAQIF